MRNENELEFSRTMQQAYMRKNIFVVKCDLLVFEPSSSSSSQQGLVSTYTIVRETLHSSIIRACRKQKSFELSFKTGSVSDGLNMIR